jgi:hypothetical protein
MRRRKHYEPHLDSRRSAAYEGKNKVLKQPEKSIFEKILNE